MEIQKLLIYGDSISTREYGEGGYEQLLQQTMQIPLLRNYAVSATSLCPTAANPALCGLDILTRTPPDADTDLILFWYGTNDWYWGLPVGELADDSANSFLGAMSQAVSCCRKRASEAMLLWLTPLPRFQAPYGKDGSDYAWVTKNLAGYTLADFNEAVFQGCRYHGISCLDIHTLANIHTANAGLYLGDGIHPNRAGYLRIAHAIAAWLSRCL